MLYVQLCQKASHTPGFTCSRNCTTSMQQAFEPTRTEPCPAFLIFLSSLVPLVSSNGLRRALNKIMVATGYASRSDALPSSLACWLVTDGRSRVNISKDSFHECRRERKGFASSRVRVKLLATSLERRMEKKVSKISENTLESSTKW